MACALVKCGSLSASTSAFYHFQRSTYLHMRVLSVARDYCRAYDRLTMHKKLSLTDRWKVHWRNIPFLIDMACFCKIIGCGAWNVARSRPSPAVSESRSRSRSGGTAVVLRGLPSSVGWYRLLRGLHGPCGSSARARHCPHHRLLVLTWCKGRHVCCDDRIYKLFTKQSTRKSQASIK